jgi:hypothetical protein
MHGPLHANILDSCLKYYTKGQLHIKMSDKREIYVKSSKFVCRLLALYTFVLILLTFVLIH